MSNLEMTALRGCCLSLLFLYSGCLEEPEPMEPVPDAGPFIPQCKVTAKTAVTCAVDGGGACPFTSGSEIDCGSPSAAVAVATAAGAGRAHALFSVMDNSNVWHTQWVTYGADVATPVIRNDALPQTQSSVSPRFLVCASAGEDPLAFMPGGRAAVLDGGPLVLESLPDSGSLGVVDGLLAPGGRGFALLSGSGGLQLASRAPDGTWTATELPGTVSYPSALALGDGGVPRVAYWVNTTSSTDELHLATPGGPDVILRREPLRSAPGRMRLAMNGADEPVVLYSYEGNHLVLADSDGGFRRVRLAEQGVTNTCPVGALHASCSECPNPTCTRRGESIIDVALAQAGDGAVYAALLMHVTDVDAKVTTKSTKVGGIEINCDCDIDVTRDDSKTTEIVLLRVVPGAASGVERKMSLAVPEAARELELQHVGGRFHVSFVDRSVTGRRPTLHHLVFDAAQLQ